jgi:hypothetical protein
VLFRELVVCDQFDGFFHFALTNFSEPALASFGNDGVQRFWVSAVVKFGIFELVFVDNYRVVICPGFLFFIGKKKIYNKNDRTFSCVF